MIKLSILFTFFTLFTISYAYAHPNHMSFEEVKHNNEHTSTTNTDTDKITHNNTQEQSGHSDIIPCTEQHKNTPCKKK